MKAIHLAPTNRQYIRHRHVGVLDTPCFPARYYVGYVFQEREEWIPADNETHNFYKTLEEAETAFLKII